MPKSKPKATSKKGKAAARASRRRPAIELEEDADDADIETGAENEDKVNAQDEDFGGRKWECVAITLGHYQEFLASIQKSRDSDERALHKRLTETVLPEIEKLEASQLRKRQKQERELVNMQKLATAKRSSRLEAKFEREKQEQEALEVERKRVEDLAAAKRDQEKQKSMEEARESRMMTRDQRLKDREFKRILHEEELANLSEENRRIEAGESQRSERHLKAEMEKKKKDLAALVEEEEWVFDCAKCGIHGTNIVSPFMLYSHVAHMLTWYKDDGSPSIACEKCNVWQHTACLGFTQEEAEKDDFHFICGDCKRREEDKKKPKIPSLKFHIGSSSSPPQDHSKVALPAANGENRKSNGEALPPKKKFKPQEDHSRPPVTVLGSLAQSNPSNQNGMHAIIMNGPQLSPQGQMKDSLYAGNASPPAGSTAFPKAPGYASRDVSSSWKPPVSETSPVLPRPPSHANNIHGNSPEKRRPWSPSKPKPRPFDAPFIPQTHQPHSNYHHYTPHSPPTQGSYQTYQNGHPQQTPQGSYQQYPSGQPAQYSNHTGYQMHASHGQPNGPVMTTWATQYTPSHETAQQRQSSIGATLSTHHRPNAQTPALQQFSDQQQTTPTHTHPTSSHAAQDGHNRSSFSNSAQGMNLSSSMTNGSSLSPGQHSTPSFPSGLPFQTPQMNGHTNNVLPPTGPPAQSPVKHASPITSFHNAPATSPIANQPPLHATNAPTSPGFSPQKQSPPSQHAVPNHTVTMATLAAIPPAPKLSPSPLQKPSLAPLKHDIHGEEQHVTSSHEHIPPAPVLSPSPAPQNLTAPVKHTTSPATGPPAHVHQQ